MQICELSKKIDPDRTGVTTTQFSDKTRLRSVKGKNIFCEKIETNNTVKDTYYGCPTVNECLLAPFDLVCLQST